MEKYFNTVEHWKLMRLLALRISDSRILHVIKQWLSCGYVEDGQHRQSKRGTPQGAVISPLLANIYLNPIDQAVERSRLGTIKAGSIHLVRYADDMLLLAQNNLEKGIEILEHYFERLGLRVNSEKTRQLDLRVDKKVVFLGFQFHRATNKNTNQRLILVATSSASQQKCPAKVRGLVNHTIPLRVTEQIAARLDQLKKIPVITAVMEAGLWLLHRAFIPVWLAQLGRNQTVSAQSLIALIFLLTLNYFFVY